MSNAPLPYSKIDEFMDAAAGRIGHRRFIQLEGVVVYIRHGAHQLGAHAERCLVVADITVSPAMERRGLAADVLRHCERVAHQHQVGLFVQSIINPLLWGMLKRRGFTMETEGVGGSAWLTWDEINRRKDQPHPHGRPGAPLA